MITAENIRKQYRDLEVLKGVDLEIKQGEIISIVGASGAGKTTLLQILGTLDTSESGQVKFNDVPISNVNHDRLVHAHWSKRLLNWFIDNAVLALINYGVLLATIMILPVEAWSYDPENYNFEIIFYSCMFLTTTLYYFTLEKLTGRTIGKLLTNTRVLSNNGKKPTAGQVLTRTLCRFIPFEAFTFIARKPQNGLHDGLANTIVIDNKAVHGSFDDLDYDQLGEDGISKFRNEQIGFVFQFHHLLPEFTAIENVCIPAYIGGMKKAEAEIRARELLQYLGLGGRLEHKPNQLSGGEQQRVAVARALMNKPAVILADEPSGNLDSKSAKELHQLFFDLRQQYNQTFIIVTHNEELAEMADRKLTIKDGIISEAQGSSSQIELSK